MAHNNLSCLQKLAYEQQTILLAHAHSQALKTFIGCNKPNKLSIKGCLDYLELAKAKLTEDEFKELSNFMKQCGEHNTDVMHVLTKIYNLFHGDAELVQGFGMFLPPDLNLQMQTGSLPLLNILKEDNEPTTENTTVDMEAQVNSVKTKTVETSDPILDVDVALEKKDCNILKEIDDDYAITYLTKVKGRFRDRPEVFEKFLTLLDSVRKDCMGARNDIETEVFLEICNLFQNHDDLIEEFKTFVPNASYDVCEEDNPEWDKSAANPTNVPEENQQSSSTVEAPKYSLVNDPSIAPVYKYGSYEEHAFFDQVRAAIGHPEVYDNFLKCLMLFNEDVITRSELLKLATPFLGKFPDLLRRFQDLLGWNESGNNIETIPMRIITLENKRKQPEVGLDIDYSTGGRNGASYRALPKEFEQPKCSGRTPLCKEVLNDTWVSFPSWSEDSTFVTSCKTQFEEIIYRCEDERFELDMALSANTYTMQILDNIQKQINKMTAEEKSMLSLDDSLGGTSTVIHHKALHRLYGDKTDELIEGLKRNPVVAVPIILKRLKVKEDEWKEKQSKFNEIWRSQIDHYYLKSLDHQGINFKQNDSKSFRPKSLLEEMEMVYAEAKANHKFNSPHFLLEFREMDIFHDAINLMLQYLKKLPGVYRDDRRKIELVVRSFIPDFFGATRATVPEEDFEAEEDSGEPPEEPMEVENDGEERSGHTSPTGSNHEEGCSDQEESNSNDENELSEETDKSFIEESDMFDKIDPLPATNLPHTLFFVSKTWYIFFRQFHILCERLARLLFESNKQSIHVKLEDAVEDNESPTEQNYRPSYRQLIEKLSLLLSGGIDYALFEEESRSLFGIHAFVSFTMDKLVLNIVRQLQQVVTDDICQQSTGFFLQHTKTVANGGFASPIEASRIEYDYLRKVEKIMDDEKCFKILWHKKDHTLTIQLIEQELEEEIPDPCDVEKWSNYLDAYVTEDSCSEDIFIDSCQSPVFLPRNLKKQMAYWKNKVKEVQRLWQMRQSLECLKKNTSITARKRKALSFLSSSVRKMSRRSSIQESCAPSVCSEITSMDGHEQTVEEKVVAQEESISDVSSSVKDIDEVSSESQFVQENEKDTEKVDVLCHISEKHIMDVEVHEELVADAIAEVKSEVLPEQEIVVQDTSTGSAFEDLCSRYVAKEETVLMMEKDEDSNSCIAISETSEKEPCDKNNTEQDQAAGHLPVVDENISQEQMDDSSLSVDNTVKVIGSEMDLSSCIDLAVEAASCVIEAIANEEEKEVDIEGSDSDTAEKQKETGDSPEVEKLIKSSTVEKIHRKTNHPGRPRKARMYQSYAKRRLKKGMSKSSRSNNSHMRKQIKQKFEEIFSDPTFDYTYFSESPEESQISHLALKYVAIKDDVEVAFVPGSYKFYFVQNCDLFLYRMNTLARSREIHQEISEIKTSNFNAWHQIWLDRYATPAMLKYCNDWLMKSDPEKFKLVRLPVSDFTKPPYIPYNKYKVRYYKTDA